MIKIDHSEGLPLSARVRHIDFSIGCITAQDHPGESFQVAVILQPPGATPTRLDAVLLDDWSEVLAVVQSLIESATKVWGMPPGAVSVDLQDGPPPTEH